MSVFGLDSHMTTRSPAGWQRHWRARQGRGRAAVMAFLISCIAACALHWNERTYVPSNPATEKAGRATSGVAGRRALVLAPVTAGASAWLAQSQAAHAAMFTWQDEFIGDARKKAAEERKKSFFNSEVWDQTLPAYKIDNLQDFLPPVYVARRGFLAKIAQMGDDNVNFTNPITYELLREENRLDPIIDLRRSCLRVKNWLEQNIPEVGGEADRLYSRIGPTLDNEDNLLFDISRAEEEYDPVVIVKEIITRQKAIVEIIDDFLELVPEEERFTAQAIADTKKIRVLRLPSYGETKKAIKKRLKKKGSTQQQEQQPVAAAASDAA